MKYQISSLKRGCLLVLMAALSACAATAPRTVSQPLQLFSESMSALKLSTDAVLEDISPASKARFMANLYEELADEDFDYDDSLLESLLITTDRATLTVEHVPFFLKLEQFKAGVGQLSQSLVDYSRLLLQLQDPELLSAETFDTMANSLNQGAFDAVNAFNPKRAPRADGNENVALFSQVTIGLVKGYLQSKQKGELTKLLKENQAVVLAFSEKMQKAIGMMAIFGQREYKFKANDLVDAALLKSSRNNAVADLIALDEQYIKELDVLRGLQQSYRDIPAAHAELVNAVEQPGARLPLIINLIETGKRLQGNYQQAWLDNDTRSLQVQADKAAAQAMLMAAEAATADLQAATADMAAVRARIAADADMNNSAKQATAAQLALTASELKAAAGRMQQQADKLRNVAEVVQQKVDNITQNLLRAQQRR